MYLFDWLLGLLLLSLTIGRVCAGKSATRLFTILLIILVPVYFFNVGAKSFIGDPAALGNLKTNTVYRVLSQCPTENNGFIITVKAPNGAFRLIQHKEQLPTPLFVVKRSFWNNKTIVEEFTAGG
ncbi:MAG: hypothetical protein WCT16_04255 [Candidatus Buchananbacteria bacterium]